MMKKIISLMLVMMLLIISLTACGGSTTGNADTPTPTPSGAETKPNNKPNNNKPNNEQNTNKPDNNDANQSDPGDGEIGNGYVDRWFLFGDLSFPSITINEDSTWEMRNIIDTDGSGGHIFCEGTSVMGEDGSLQLYEKDGDEVGFATLEEDELTLVLTEDFEWTFADYLSGDLTFNREGASVSYESQPEEDDDNNNNEEDDENDWSDPGDGGIGNGYVDRWFLFGDLSFPSITINEDSRWEMRNPIDTDGSGGRIFCEGYSSMDENGELFLYEKDGGEVGFATLEEDELTLVLTEDFEWTFADYLSGDLAFNREGASMSYEGQ